MRTGGFVELARIYLAEGLRWLARGPLWCVEAITVAADCADPAMPESVRRPREWLPRLWSRTGGRTPGEDRD